MYNRTISPSEKRTTRIVSFTSLILFGIFCFSYLAVSYRYLLSTTEDLSLFVFNLDFFLIKAYQPGGILLYISSFFTQFLYYPWLGALIITLFLQLIQQLTYKAFEFNHKYMILSYIPSFLLLAVITNTGRSLYLMTHVEYMFTYILGTLILLSAYTIFTRIKAVKNRLITICFLLPILFFGMSGSIAIYFSLLILLKTTSTANNKGNFKTLLLAFTLYLASFFLAAYLIFPHADYHQVLFGVKPAIPVDQQWASILPHILLAFFFLIIAIKQRISLFQNRINSYSRWTYTNLIVLSIFCAITASLANSYDDFRYEMAIDNSIQNKDFDRALRVGKGSIHPTREMSVLRNFALVLAGKSGEKMFEYTQDWGTDGLFFDYNKGEAGHPDGAYIYSYLGANNMAKEWVDNNHNNKEYSFRMLNNFVLVAAVNGNWQVANKVSSALHQTLFHDDLANKYDALAQDTSLVNQDPILSDIRKRVSSKKYEIPNKGTYTAFIDLFYAENPDNRVAFDYYMMSALLEKRIHKFVLGLNQYHHFYKDAPLPKHYAEALALYKYIHKKNQIVVDQKTQKVFDEYLKLKADQKDPLTEKNLMRRSYGETYWWYYWYH